MNQNYGQSPLRTGASNPEMVRRHIGQDLGYYGPQGQVTNQGYQTQGYMGQGGSRSTLSQFGSQPQYVQQQIRGDWPQGQSMDGQGYGNSPMHMHVTNTAAVRSQIQPLSTSSQYGGQSVGIQQQGQYSGGGYQGFNESVLRDVMSAAPSSTRQVQSNVSQNLGRQNYMSSGQYQGSYGSSAFSQFGTNPQTVQQHIREDLGYQGQGNTQGSAMRTVGTNTSMFSQFGTNPQVVQQHIRQDMSQGNSQGYYQGMGQKNYYQ